VKPATWILAACLPLSAQVPFERIRGAEREPGNWLTYSGNYSAHRHSLLAQINAANVAHLKPVWVYQVTTPGRVETTPLVVDGVMYLTEPPSNVTALDTRTGRPLWRFQRPVPGDVHVCCGQVNRGVALLDDLVFVGTVDSHLIALDSKTGQVRWDVTVADYKTGYSITVAPLAVKNKVVVGIAAANSAFVDSLTPMTRNPASVPGAFGRCLVRESPATTPGPAKVGERDRPPPG